MEMSQQTISGWRRYILMEPLLMTLLLTYAMTGTILTDLIVYRTCTVTLKINDSMCLLLRQNGSSNEAKDLETKAQPYASIILMAKSLIESVLPAILSLFLGPWSDRYGRKPLLLAGFTGYTIMYLMLSLMSTWNINPWFLLISSIPLAILGGFCAIILAAFCLIADITTENERGWYLTWLQVSVSVGILLGIFSGPIIYEQFGDSAVFGTAGVCCILALLYVLFCIPETVNNPPKLSICTLFDLSLVKEGFSSCLTKREGFNRKVVWCCILILTQIILITEGESSIGFLYVRERLNWGVQQYSYYSAVNVVVGVTGTLLAVKILNGVLGCNELALVALGCISSLGAAITKSLVWHPWHMYLAVVIGMFGGAAGPMTRAVLSKAAPPQDVGKVFSLTTSMEAVSPLGASPLYTLIYTRYMPPIFPSPVWLVSAGFYFIMILLMLCIALFVRRRTQSRYQLIADHSE